MNISQYIADGKAVLGIELGSTRIKSVLIDADRNPIAQGSHVWANQLARGLWSYSIEDIWSGLQASYADLRSDVMKKYGVEIESLAAIGISAMMHGYMAFGSDAEILVPFRTWRNTNTGKAAAKLSALFDFNIPLRWSISHLCQAMLDSEPHVGSIDYLTTLSGYIHWQLSGRRVLGVGDASGMFPVDPATGTYDSRMVSLFDDLAAPMGFGWKLKDILPESLPAGADAGVLTPEGALRLDASGHLKPGIPMCPPEGDAGTGMVATNSVRQRTGNVSAGTSSFSMIVLERPLSRPYEAIDIVTTPDGSPVAMVHCNNCSSDLDGWAGLFSEFQQYLGESCDMGRIYQALFAAADKGDPDCGGLISYNYVAGEPLTGFPEGRPLFVRSATDRFTLPNFMRSILYATVVVLKSGNSVLLKDEGVRVDRITAHGGLFKQEGVAQRVLASALDAPVSVMKTAGEGGAWGIAILADYLVHNPERKTLADYLEQDVFKGDTGTEISPRPEDVAGFDRYCDEYMRCLEIEKAAVQNKKI